MVDICPHFSKAFDKVSHNINKVNNWARWYSNSSGYMTGLEIILKQYSKLIFLKPE